MTNSRRQVVLRRVTWILIAFIGLAASLIAITRTDDDPLGTLLAEWPMVAAAGGLYLVGMSIYSVSWSQLFDRSDNRRLISLGFLISQPVKYLPGGIAQPIGQITLTAQALGSTRRALVAFPAHVLINIVAAVTLGAPLLFFSEVAPLWRWLIVLVPMVWAALNRRWMAGLLSLLARLHRMFQVSSDLPAQSHINAAFGWALLAHAAMFASFGVLTAGSVPGWSVVSLSLAYAIAWLVGYVALPAPAGLGAREAALVLFLGGAITAVDAVRISAVHRIATLVVELTLLVVAAVMTRGVFTSTRETPRRIRTPHDEISPVRKRDEDTI
ncbi:MAG TPA: hypothetical protein VMP13_02645 [Acidimicrobiia bacterium]|nr:hypothetical protein [Acidimicrobiia bacterium]